MSARLERSTTNKVAAGVCGGIAEYLQVDPTLVRVFFVVGTILSGGLGFLGYVLLVVLMPLPGQPAPFGKTAGATTSTLEGAASREALTTSDPQATAPSVAAPADPEAEERRRATIGLILVALGAIFLFSNAGVFRIVRWDLAWPLVLIAIGALLLVQRVRR
ncbi:MAG TPA: PspC domain-containing protein [Candidatus Limnocylindria bacterium]|jgi:phage shock protein C|nr:PspC domain-containing protein [Candidatus Limnocylindria bacterium]